MTTAAYSPITGFATTNAPYIADSGDLADITVALKSLYYGPGQTASNTAGIYGMLYWLQNSPTFAGSIAVNGSAITSTTTTFNLLNTTVTTLNIGGFATATTIGKTGSNNTLNGTWTTTTQSIGDSQSVVATDSFVLTQIGESLGASLFGWGQDGSYTLNASQAAVTGLFSKTGTVFTLLKTAYFQNLNIASGYTLDPGGFAFFVAGTLTLNGANAISHTATAGGNAQSYPIGNSGGNAITAVTLGYQTVATATAGGSGGAPSAAGSNGSSSGTPTWANVYSNVWRQSAGGTGATGNTGLSGGTGGITVSDSGTREWRYPLVQFMTMTTQPLFVASGTSLGYYMGASGSGGGGGGGYVTTYAGGGGGGGGQGNTGAFIIAKHIITSGTASEISFVGGTGGTGGSGSSSGSGGGGGGAGGQGGFVYIVAGYVTGGFTGSSINVSGGNGGNAGSVGVNTAYPGSGGYSGTVVYAHLSKGTVAIYTPVAPSGQTAGTSTIPILQ
jgi:hypothetical protein